MKRTNLDHEIVNELQSIIDNFINNLIFRKTYSHNFGTYFLNRGRAKSEK